MTATDATSGVPPIRRDPLVGTTVNLDQNPLLANTIKQYSNDPLYAGFKYVPPTITSGLNTMGLQQDLYKQMGAWAGAHQDRYPKPTAPTAGPAQQYDPAAQYNQRPTGGLPGLNTGGVNPYLSGSGNMGGFSYLQNPLMSGFYGMQNPLYTNQQQQDFYGDPELFSGGY